MRWAIILGVLLVAVPLTMRAGTTDPFENDSSYATIADKGSVLAVSAHAVPPQLLLILATTATLFLLAASGAGESALLLLVTAPAFLNAASTYDATPFGMVLIAFGAFLLSRKRFWAVALVPVCFLVSTSTGILGSLVFIVVAVMAGFPFVALGVSFFALVTSTALAIVSPNTAFGFVNPSSFWNGIFLGTTEGVTLFLVAVGVLGMALRFGETKEASSFLPLALVAIAPLFTGGGVVVAGALAYTGSVAVDYLLAREWKFEELGSITLVLIACTVLFTTIVTFQSLADIDEDRVELRSFVREGIPETSVVALDTPAHGALAIEGIESRRAQIPRDASFVASTLREEGYTHVLARGKEPLYNHFPLIFATTSPTTYRLYEVPSR